MTWSNRGHRPHAAPRAPAAAPMAWAPDELVLDTQSLRDVLQRTDAPASGPAEVPAVDLAAMELALHEAYERGLEEGRRVGEASEAARLRRAMQAVDEALASLHGGTQTWIGNAEENICALAIAVARQVIGREVAMDKSSLAGMVRQALDEFPLDQPITLRVHPADLPAITAALHAMGDTSPLAARREVQWLPDSRIAVGGCLIEGRDRIIDGRVDTALERLYRRLTSTGA